MFQTGEAIEIGDLLIALLLSIADARRSRVAKRSPLLAVAQFDCGTLNSLETAR